MAKVTRVRESFHHLPPQSWTRAAYTVIRAGRIETAKDHRIERDSYPGQDLLYCHSGAGVVKTLNREFDIGANQLVWIANELPHSHAPHRKHPWKLLWCRIDGPDPAAIRYRLFGSGPPVTTFADAAALFSWFERLFQVQRLRDIDRDLQLNFIVAELFALIERSGVAQSRPPIPAALSVVRSAMLAHPERPWRAADLSSLTGLSTSQIRRLFQQHLSTSPHRWLIRERVILAQTLLVNAAMPISEIAERCGFCDVYHFGREFKRIVGMAPAAWRQSEIN